MQQIAKTNRALKQLTLTGLALIVLTLAGLVIPGSILQYSVLPGEVPGEPLRQIYDSDFEHLLLFVALFALVGVFVIAVAIASRITSGAGVRLALGGTVLLAALFVVVYPSGANDVFHNVADARTLWIHHENPLSVPPSANGGSPIVDAVPAWRDQTSSYGLLAYVAYGPLVLLAGDGILANLLIVKAFHGVLLVLLTWLVGWAAADLSPGRRVQAMVLVGWNPFLLYEAVGNAHNDLVMMVLAVAGLAVTVRQLPFGGLATIGLSSTVKFMTGLTAPLAFVWLWLNASRKQRRGLIAMEGIAVAVVVAILTLAWRDVGQMVSFASPSFGMKSATSVASSGLSRVGIVEATDGARYVSWALLGVVGLATLKSLDRSKRSLWVTSFWLLAAAAVLGPSTFWAWYLLWFIPLGAVLAGSREAKLAMLVSATGLLSYGIFPWLFVDAVGVYYVAFVFLLPAAFMLLSESPSLPGARWGKMGYRRKVLSSE